MVQAVFHFDERIMAAGLNDRTVVQHDDFIAEPAGREPVADEDGCFVGADRVKLPVDFRLGDGVERSGRLIKDVYRCILVYRTGNGDFLRLAAGDVDAFLT